MIEVVYSGHAGENDRSNSVMQQARDNVAGKSPENSGESAVFSSTQWGDEMRPAKRTLKNIRQIGTAGPDTKIYVENSVLQFLQQHMRQKLNCLAALLGNFDRDQDTDIFYIQGVVLADRIHLKGTRLEFEMQAFQMIQEDMETFFPGLIMMGWYLPVADLAKSYGTVLGERGSLFFMNGAEEEEGAFFLLRNAQFVEQTGYYVYYEHNAEMKSYLMACERKIEESITPQAGKEPETGGNPERAKIPAFRFTRAQKDTRYEKGPIGRKDADKKEPENSGFVDDYVDDEDDGSEFAPPQTEIGKITGFLYGASAVLAIVVLVIGITLVNNYEKMYELQDSLNTVVGVLKPTLEPTEGAVMSAEPQVQDTGASNAQSETAQSGVSESQVNEASVPVEGVQNTLQYYTIQAGDTLASISRKIYNTEDKINEICAANNIQSESELIVGEKLLLP